MEVRGLPFCHLNTGDAHTPHIHLYVHRRRTREEERGGRISTTAMLGCHPIRYAYY